MPSIFQLLHGLSGALLASDKFIALLSLFDRDGGDESLDALDVVDVEVDLLLEHVEVLVHLNLEVVAPSL